MIKYFGLVDDATSQMIEKQKLRIYIYKAKSCIQICMYIASTDQENKLFEIEKAILDKCERKVSISQKGEYWLLDTRYGELAKKLQSKYDGYNFDEISNQLLEAFNKTIKEIDDIFANFLENQKS